MCSFLLSVGIQHNRYPSTRLTNFGGNGSVIDFAGVWQPLNNRIIQGAR
jgi:hypothetical protein